MIIRACDLCGWWERLGGCPGWVDGGSRGGRGRLRLVVGRFVGVVCSLVMVGCGWGRSPCHWQGVRGFFAGGEEWGAWRRSWVVGAGGGGRWFLR